MNIIRGAMNLLLKQEPSEESGSTWERMARELKGCLFVLLALFELVSLTSYIPIDTFAIFHGRLDHVNNLGGIVGAMLGEWYLGMLGIAGYALVALTLWLAANAFRGVGFRTMLPRMVSALFGIFLAAVSCQLLLSEQFPEASLFQGGKWGHFVGVFLRHYFNTAGALLLVLGAFVITLILSTGLSPSSIFRNIFASDEDENDVERIAPVSSPQIATVTPIRPSVAPQPEKKAAKKRRTKKKEEDGLAPVDENSDEASGMLANGEDPSDAVDENASPAEFKIREMIPFEGSYAQPSLRLMKGASNGVKKLSRGEIKDNAEKLVEHLLSFQITGEVTAVTQGPVLITYEFKPSAGIKLSKIANLQDDLGIVMGTGELRIVAPIPGKTVVGIEVPRPKSEIISLKDCLAEKEFNDKKLRLPFALGKATDGVPVFADMAALPHLLVAGSTGSGKSVFVNSLIMSFLYRCSPQQLRMILVDPKMLELNAFEGIPHLVSSVITDNTVAYNALNWAVWEMERRYALMASSGSKNIDSFNEKQKSASAKIPFLVIVVDELADLMMSGGEAVEVAITRLAQKARAAGIHLVLATQRPSAEVLTGLIKANIPSRLSFKVPSGIDSRTVLDTSGAEELIGRGDSLMIRGGVPMQRLHGTFVTEEELHRVVKFVKDGKDYSKNYIDFRGGSIPG